MLWGIVDVPSIRAYMTLPFAYGADYQIYYFLCLLKSVGEVARGCLCWPVSKSLPSFDAACSLEEMHRLRDKYRALCLARMAAFCGVSTTTAQMLKSRERERERERERKSVLLVALFFFLTLSKVAVPSYDSTWIDSSGI